MTRIAAVSAVLPPHRYAQGEITDALAAVCLPPGADRGVIDRLHSSAGVRQRHLTLELACYGGLSGFGEANDLYIRAALDLGGRALCEALDAAGLRADEIDLVLSTSVTGVAAPSLEARLAARLGMRPDVKRLPVFGLGCAAGAAGLARVHDHLTGRPREAAVLLSTELCSLTLQPDDTSGAGTVAGALFGDGAGALVAVGDDHPAARSDADPADRTAGRPTPGCGPVVLATRSRLYPGTGGLLGWDIGDRGFRIVLGGELPDLVRLSVAEEVRDFLAGHDLKPDDVTEWICHPGGPKILDALEEALGLPADALDASRRSLAEVGNLSSASVLHILRDVMARRAPAPGSTGLLLAVGPGVASELVLLRW